MPQTRPFRRKLDAQTASRIRVRYTRGEEPRVLAEEFGVALSSLYDVLRGRTYPPRVTIVVDDDVLARLDAAAHRVNQTRETFAAACIRQCVGAVNP